MTRYELSCVHRALYSTAIMTGVFDTQEVMEVCIDLIEIIDSTDFIADACALKETYPESKQTLLRIYALTDEPYEMANIIFKWELKQ